VARPATRKVPILEKGAAGRLAAQRAAGKAPPREQCQGSTTFIADITFCRKVVAVLVDGWVA